MSFFENKRNFIRVDRRTGKRRFKHNQYTKKYCTTQPVVNTSEVNMSFVNVNLVLDAYVNITPVNTPPIDIHFDPDPDFSVVVVVDIPNTSSSRNHLEKDTHVIMEDCVILIKKKLLICLITYLLLLQRKSSKHMKVEMK